VGTAQRIRSHGQRIRSLLSVANPDGRSDSHENVSCRAHRADRTPRAVQSPPGKGSRDQRGGRLCESSHLTTAVSAYIASHELWPTSGSSVYLISRAP
jgi:hypothetical protein